MGRQLWLPIWQLYAVLLLLLLTSASCWGISRSKKPANTAVIDTKHNPAIAHKLPPNTFVRIFALPSFEAKLAQHRLGELLAASCKNHARVGGCRLYSASLDSHHLRVLEFEEAGNKSVVAYMLQEHQEDAEKALQECAKRHEGPASAQENGKDYRCYNNQTTTMPTRSEVLGELKEQLEKVGVYQQLSTAQLKSIFLTTDPKQIVYQESQRLVGDNGDQDFFLQTIRDSFRRIVEWLSWQYQQFSTMAEGTPVLFSYAEDLDGSEKDEISRILDFLDIEDLHVVHETVTATRGEIRFQKERLRAAILSLPKALIADIEAFIDETLQDKRMMGRYLGVPRNHTALWPPPMMLQHLASDNTLLITAATCAYAPLVVNWMKHVHALGIPCYLVIALDDELYDFLHGWLPEHVVRAPPDFIPAVPGQYAARGTPEMRHLSKARIAALRALTDQGYHAAWADADIAFTQNLFSILNRWFDLTATWTGGDESPLPISEKVIGYEQKFNKTDKLRRVSPSFLFLRGTEPAKIFLEKWWQAANSSHAGDDGAILDELLREREVNTALSIQMLPESTFPSGDNLYSNSSAAYQKEWETMPPAWAHPDSAQQMEDKILLLTSGKTWKVEEDPLPKCSRPKHDFLPDGSAVPVWPPAELLSSIAQDDTILVTSASCAYADLLTNWLKHIWDMQIKCFFVAAADEATAEFLADWMPKHSSQIPAKLVNQVKKFAQKETPEYTKVVQSKPEVLRAILAQGYNVAWSDADIAWIRNPFTLFSKEPDLVLAWADNSKITPGSVMQPGEFPGRDARKISSSFVFVRPGPLTLKLMERWAEKLSGSSYVDDAAALSELLRSSEFHKHLTIGVFPSAVFPSGKESSGNSPHMEKLKEAWEDASSKPAWLHADSTVSHEGKSKLFKSNRLWKLEAKEPQPKCKTWGRKLGDDEPDADLAPAEDVPVRRRRLPENPPPRRRSIP